MRLFFDGKGENLLGQAKTAMLFGAKGIIVSVECDVSEGLPGFYMVGHLNSEVREAKERIMSALKNSGFKLSAKKITVNMSPASIRKAGTGFDLPLAIAILCGYGVLHSEILDKTVLIGEVKLNGYIKGVSGVLPMLLAAKKKGYKYGIVSEENIQEAGLVDGMDFIAASNLKDLVKCLQSSHGIHNFYERKEDIMEEEIERKGIIPDFSEIKGQFMLKRACEIAASGMHNLLMIGPPGAGKTIMASAMTGIMPKLQEEEKVEITSIYSACGLLDEHKHLIKERPFRNPHHKITPRGLIGGGNPAKPGEVSLASHGILFLDELPEFSTQALESLRQPLEEREVRITRAGVHYVFSADFCLVAAMNPCPCGYYPDLSKCNCTKYMIGKYLGRISGPLLDRIDMCVSVPRVNYKELVDLPGEETSDMIRRRVVNTQEIQRERFKKIGITYNSQMNAGMLEEFCRLDKESREYMEKCYDKMQFTARTYHRMIKVARTIADMQEKRDITLLDIQEATLYREDVYSWR